MVLLGVHEPKVIPQERFLLPGNLKNNKGSNVPFQMHHKISVKCQLRRLVHNIFYLSIELNNGSTILIEGNIFAHQKESLA